MKFFHVQNLNHAFAQRPTLNEFLQLLVAFQAKVQPQKQTLYFADFFAQVEKEIPQHKLSAQLKSLIALEQDDLEQGNINHLVNKVIFNEFESAPLNLTRSEFHEHTYDIHLVFSGKEQYIYQLGSLEANTQLEKDPVEAHDTIFAYNLPYLKTTYLNAHEGIIISPGIAHFAGFAVLAPEVVKKCVVKVDARYAKLLELA
ncbi:hypothetical protein CJP74_05105 [Psittacicella melopsittaci]|uniref:YhcH/YjgK/YiaL family protein n=1 Tax=Psittacicella melopsittaci TaxID=2028576 RepID=A0A3A1Y7N3_9GAMM|nr:YhcH/YjgK/YiaL family protein [Psittacicella melopsittaci]RIY32147.1 hypothetical protein CJP74_05105 [Psittacicella melopsittaci]